jgi:hypothetical protein
MKKKILSFVICTLFSISSLAPVLLVKSEDAPSSIPAFPGAEGGGMYTSGGRGCDVYEVTNLNDSGPGSLRDAISQDNRTVVFRISGTINLLSSLGFGGRKNITIAGQSAPGDGICLAGWNVDLTNSTNIIMRYLRVRPGSANIKSEPDGMGGRGANYLMLDHISTSWSTDETMSFYENQNTTVQWSIINESLTLSGHIKGRHGYGGIWGGTNATFHHNILANHTSRAPRIGNGATPGYQTMANNVVYNWQFNNTYGGLLGYQVNLVNNYYKPGPSTLDSVKGRIANPGDGDFYVNGNYLYGSPEASADNRLGLQDISEKAVFSKTPFKNSSYTNIKIQDAETAYNEVLNKAGAVLPKRDATDARIIQDVKNGTGRIINREFEVGGFPELKSAEAPVDTDHDGMPDTWETEKGLKLNDAADGKIITASGYSNLELYLNNLADMSYVPDNPVVKVTTPRYNALYAEGGQMTIDVDTTDKDGIEKVEFYVGANSTLTNTKVGEDLTAPYSFTINALKADTYFISAKAYDKNGNATQSTSMPVHVNGPEVGGPWNSLDIGSTPVKGSGSMDASGTLIVKGSGKIAGNNDKFHFVYQPINGNATLTAKLDYMTLLDNNAISGLMIRDSLEPDAAEAFISTAIVKADRDENANGSGDDTYYYTYFSSRMSKGETVQTLDNKVYPSDTLPALIDCKLPIWLKIERVDNEIITYTSYDNIAWKELSRKNFNMGKEAYIGFAVDATQPAMQDIYYNTAKFSNINFSNSFTVTSISLTDSLGNALQNITPGVSAEANVTVNKNSLAITNATIAIEICDANDRVISTSYVKSNFGAGTTKTVKAGFSTPINLKGIKIKAYVINNTKDKMIISNVSNK